MENRKTMSEQQRLQHDTASTIARHLVEAIRFDREEQEREAYTVFYEACLAGLQSYEVMKNRRDLNLKPGRN
jgi:hypothetical protein